MDNNTKKTLMSELLNRYEQLKSAKNNQEIIQEYIKKLEKQLKNLL